jgi:hypothetical protein
MLKRSGFPGPSNLSSYDPGPDDWGRLRCWCCRAGLLMDAAKHGHTSRMQWMMEQMDQENQDDDSETGERDDGISEENLAVRAQHASPVSQAGCIAAPTAPQRSLAVCC